MAEGTLVLVDAGMAAGFRRAKPALSQLHQALVHLHRQHPDARVAVLCDPALKWDVSAAEAAAFEGDIVAGALVCAPAGATEGTAGFLARTARKARALGYSVVAFTDRAVTDVALGRLRNDAGRWVWDLDATRTLDADRAAAPVVRRRRRSR
jgi:hypothetical protein